jgi:nuclear pore complex protein Nup133
VLNLPYPVKTAESLPIASLLTNSASSDVGLVLVYPHSGKITFWENVDSAESLKLFDQRRQGIEGTIKLLGGEVIESVVDAEHAGFILLTSAGRLAQLTIRDAQGRPHIHATFLSSNGSKGSFFGELVQMFHTSWRNRPTAVKTRPSTKGRMEIIALTNEGVFKVWDASWAGHNSLVGDLDASVEVRAILSKFGILDQEQKKAVKFLDFALLPNPSNELATNGSSSIHALLLVATDDEFTSKLQLIQITLTSGVVSAKSVLPLTVYQPEIGLGPHPQLILTGFDPMAFIIHEETVVVVSLSGLFEDSMAASSKSLSAYQDVFHFRGQKGGRIVGSSAEPISYSSKHDTSNILLFTKSAGVIRISVNNQPVGSVKSNLPTAKSKMEQWVYYGAAPDNILDLTNTAGLSFSTNDIEMAALQISQDILKTDTDYLPAVAHSMDQHLTLRTKALQDLAVFLKNHCSPLSRTAKWTLLWDAEKMAAARAIWREHEVRLQQKASDELTLLEQAIDLALERYKDDGNSQVEETDDVRLWFTKEVYRIEKLFPLAYKIIRDSWNSGEKESVTIFRWMKESSDMILSGLGTPFDMRQQKMDDYCLADEKIEHGVLLSGFEGLPEFWTSKANTTSAISMTVNQTENFISSLLKKDSDQSSSSLVGLARRIASQADAVIKLSCKSHVERYRWLLAQEDEAVHAQGLNIQHQFETKIRRDQIVSLFDIGESLRGLILAEDVGDFSALVELSLRELDFQKSRLQKANSSAARRQNASSTDELKYIETQIAHYFQKFGQDFAAQFHKGQISSHRLADLMDKDLGPKEERTKFLRSNPSCAKLSWINEALNEEDMVQTGKSLMVAARDQEPNVWCKKLELSLAKLASKAIRSNPQPPSDRPNGITVINEEEEAKNVIVQSDRELAVLEIQQQLYNHVRPTILEALDQDAAPQEVMRKFGSAITESRSSLAELLRNGFSDLLSHRCIKPETLIDVLTLMDQIPGESSPVPVAGTHELDAGSSNIYGKEFYLALKVLEAADLEDNQVEMLRRLIWKRCLLRDDWPTLNTTNEKSDRDMAEGLMQTAAFETIKEGVRRGSYHIYRILPPVALC